MHVIPALGENQNQGWQFQKLSTINCILRRATGTIFLAVKVLLTNHEGTLEGGVWHV